MYTSLHQCSSAQGDDRTVDDYLVEMMPVSWGAEPAVKELVSAQKLLRLPA